MKVSFNNTLESLYAIEYCASRDRSIIKQRFDSEQEGAFFNEIYRLCIEKIPRETRYFVMDLGDYHRIAEYVLMGSGELPDLTILKNYFAQNDTVHQRIISDIKDDETLRRLNFAELSAFLYVRAEDISRGDVRDPVLCSDPLCLCAFSRSGNSEHYYLHNHILLILQKTLLHVSFAETARRAVSANDTYIQTE